MSNNAVWKKSLILGIVILVVGAAIIPNIIGTGILSKNTENYFKTINTVSNQKINTNLISTGFLENWSLTELVSSESINDSRTPSLAVDSNGTIHVAWYDETNYSECGNDYCFCRLCNIKR